MKLSYTWNNQTYSTADSDRFDPEQKEAVETAVSVLGTTFKIHPKSIWYLLQYGWSQSLQDAYAQTRAKAIKDGENIEDAVLASLEKRVRSIRDGLLSASGGGGRDPVRSVGLAMLKAHVQSKNRSLPKDKDKLKALLDKFIELDFDKINAEIALRKRTSGPEADLDDLEME